MDAREIAAKEEAILREFGDNYKGLKFSHHKNGWDVFYGRYLILKNQPDIDRDLIEGAIEELTAEIMEFESLQMNFVAISKQTKKRELKSESVYVHTLLYTFMIAGFRWDYSIPISEEKFEQPLRPVEILLRQGIRKITEECDQAVQNNINEEPILRIRNLVGEIRSICEDHELPFFFSVARSNSAEGTEYFSDVLTPADVDNPLRDDKITPALQVLLGYKAVLPAHVKDFLVDEDGDDFFYADSDAEADMVEEASQDSSALPFDYD